MVDIVDETLEVTGVNGAFAAGFLLHILENPVVTCFGIAFCNGTVFC